MRKHSLILGLILTVIAGFVFWINSREHRTPKTTLSPSPVEQSSGQENAAVLGENVAPLQEDTEPMTLTETVRDMFPEDSITDPEMKKLLEVFDSPEFAAFTEAGDYSAEAFYGFLASQGIPWDRDAYYREFQENFQKYFPGETPQGLEPQMRQALMDIFAESNAEDAAGMLQTTITGFLADPKYRAWLTARFPGREKEFGDWAVGIMKDYLKPSSTDPSAVVKTDAPVFPTENELADENLFSDSPTESSEPLTTPSIDPPVFEDGDLLTENEANSGAESPVLLEQTSPEAPQLPTEASIEKTLRDAFSPQRFNTAMQTLNRYGPEEGLRRLKKSDPEVATQIERLIQRNQEEND